MMGGKYLKAQTFIFGADIGSFEFSAEGKILLIGLKSGLLQVFYQNNLYEERQSLKISNKTL